MTLIIVTILLLGFLLISTERLTNINKSAVAIFIGTVGWMLYICYGTDYVMSEYRAEYLSFLGGLQSTSSLVKQFIAQNVFLKYVGRAAEILLFLLATMTIVEILQNNGCFDFIRGLLRTRSSRKMLWTLSAATFVLSANLDNLTTTIMMIMMMHGIVRNRRQRMLLGCAILISTNCGGVLTVIGDPIGLVLWNSGAVTATDYSLSLAVPCLLAWALPVWWIGRLLPERLDTEWITMPYRGDDTNLNVWQRLVMLFVGIGGLWFIPTFHNITKLSPFIGALCVLSVLWVVNELMNRKLINASEMFQSRIPRSVQYGTIQMMLFVVGIMLATGVVKETGAMADIAAFLDDKAGNVWITGVMTGCVSSFLDNFATAMTMISLRDTDFATTAPALMQATPYIQNGIYWKVIAYASAIGGNILCTSSMSGIALMKMERIHFTWYFRNVGWRAMAGAVAGFAALWLIIGL